MNGFIKPRKHFGLIFGFVIIWVVCFVVCFYLHCVSHVSSKSRYVAEIISYYGINNLFGFSMGLGLNEGRQKGLLRSLVKNATSNFKCTNMLDYFIII